jgi:hypothetical protein
VVVVQPWRGGQHSWGGSHLKRQIKRLRERGSGETREARGWSWWLCHHAVVSDHRGHRCSCPVRLWAFDRWKGVSGSRFLLCSEIEEKSSLRKLFLLVYGFAIRLFEYPLCSSCWVGFFVSFWWPIEGRKSWEKKIGCPPCLAKNGEARC